MELYRIRFRLKESDFWHTWKVFNTSMESAIADVKDKAKREFPTQEIASLIADSTQGGNILL